MILIVTALKHEALPIINKLNLKRINSQFATYKNDEYLLVISGTGQTKCAAATGWAFGFIENITGAVNIGCAGTSDNNINLGTLCLGNIVESENTKNVFIPDILYTHSLKECRICTYDNIVKNTEIDNNTAFDMEAYGFMSAGSSFLTNDRLACVKLISDYTYENSLPTGNELKELFEKGSAQLLAFLEQFRIYCEASITTPDDNLTNVIDIISQKYSFTEARRNILKTELHNTLVYYNALPDINLLPEIQGHEKKHSAEAFSSLIYNLKNNINCIPAKCTEQSHSNCKRDFFRHIYVEKNIRDNPCVQSVLKKFSDSEIVEIPHYKSVFNRKKQNAANQSFNKNLILARADGNLIYKGSDYCNAFGFERFYYCSTIMGCIYNCAYCYLQGMYPSSNITAFVNTRDFFDAINNIDDGTPALICCSYDSDILALDSILNTVEQWLEFAQSKPHITFEIRTKSANIRPLMRDVVKNVIIAYTLSPDVVCKEYESSAPSTSMRLNAAETLADMGWRVRLCIEPVLAPIVNEEEYYILADNIISEAQKTNFEDIVIGEFRMNSPYFKQISTQKPYCKLFANPFIEDKAGSISYRNSKDVLPKLCNYIQSNSHLNVICFGNNT